MDKTKTEEIEAKIEELEERLRILSQKVKPSNKEKSS